MKLIFCPICADVFRLTYTDRRCMCGRSAGKYDTDGLVAQIYGKAIALGFENSSFVAAVRAQPNSGDGRRFDAFVIAQDCETVKKPDKDNKVDLTVYRRQRGIKLA